VDYGSDPTCLNNAGHNALKMATLQQQKALGAAGKHSAKIQAIGITEFLSGLENIQKSAKSTGVEEPSSRANFLSVDNVKLSRSDPFELSRRKNATRDQLQLQTNTPTPYNRASSTQAETRPIMKPQSLPSNHSVFGAHNNNGTVLLCAVL
jgi:hypothetical protein